MSKSSLSFDNGEEITLDQFDLVISSFIHFLIIGFILIKFWNGSRCLFSVSFRLLFEHCRLRT